MRAIIPGMPNLQPAEELAFASPLFDEPLWWAATARTLLEPVVLVVAARDDV